MGIGTLRRSRKEHQINSAKQKKAAKKKKAALKKDRDGSKRKSTS